MMWLNPVGWRLEWIVILAITFARLPNKLIRFYLTESRHFNSSRTLRFDTREPDSWCAKTPEQADWKQQMTEVFLFHLACILIYFVIKVLISCCFPLNVILCLFTVCCPFLLKFCCQSMVSARMSTFCFHLLFDC